jgi:hypothetical protein
MLERVRFDERGTGNGASFSEHSYRARPRLYKSVSKDIVPCAGSHLEHQRDRATQLHDLYFIFLLNHKHSFAFAPSHAVQFRLALLTRKKCDEFIFDALRS